MENPSRRIAVGWCSNSGGWQTRQESGSVSLYRAVEYGRPGKIVTGIDGYQLSGIREKRIAIDRQNIEIRLYNSSEGLTPLKNENDPHFDAASQLILGERYAKEVKKLMDR